MPNSCRLQTFSVVCIKYCDCLYCNSAAATYGTHIVGSAPQSTGASVLFCSMLAASDQTGKVHDHNICYIIPDCTGKLFDCTTMASMFSTFRFEVELI